MSEREKMNRVGEIMKNKQGSVMKIIEYIDYNNTLIEFKNGYKVNNSYSNFKKGLIKNPYDKTVYNVGYIGIDNYSQLKNISYQKSYKIWRDMLHRCYSKKSSNNTYNDCYVCEEWLSYNNFLKWFDINYYEISSEKIHLDKDLICKNNKKYSSETCIFIPQTINQVFQTHIKNKKGLPVGVSGTDGHYIVSICDNMNKKRIYFKNIKTIEDGRDIYLKHKRLYILKLADFYKENIPKKLYDLLINQSEVYDYE